MILHSTFLSFQTPAPTTQSCRFVSVSSANRKETLSTTGASFQRISALHTCISNEDSVLMSNYIINFPFYRFCLRTVTVLELLQVKKLICWLILQWSVWSAALTLACGWTEFKLFARHRGSGLFLFEGHPVTASTVPWQPCQSIAAEPDRQ